MQNSWKLMKAIVSSQSKGCALFLQLGTTALMWKPKWARNRDVALIHAEIDTPRERLRVKVFGWRKRNRRLSSITLAIKHNRKEGNGYRDRWLRKLGYI